MKVASDKVVYMWYLNLVVRLLYSINCLKPLASNCATLCSQKLCCGTAFLHKNGETQRILQDCSSKHSIKKDMFFCLGQIEII